MYSIREVSRLTGITTYTLRYYEKIGLIPSPTRAQGKKDGARQYSDKDLQFIHFIHELKQTGMKLQDILLYARGGCVRNQIRTQNQADASCQHNDTVDVSDLLRTRIEILDKHTAELEQQMERLHRVSQVAQEKRQLFTDMLETLAQAQDKEASGIRLDLR